MQMCCGARVPWMAFRHTTWLWARIRTLVLRRWSRTLADAGRLKRTCATRSDLRNRLGTRSWIITNSPPFFFTLCAVIRLLVSFVTFSRHSLATYRLAPSVSDTKKSHEISGAVCTFEISTRPFKCSRPRVEAIEVEMEMEEETRTRRCHCWVDICIRSWAVSHRFSFSPFSGWPQAKQSIQQASKQHTSNAEVSQSTCFVLFFSLHCVLFPASSSVTQSCCWTLNPETVG